MKKSVLLFFLLVFLVSCGQAETKDASSITTVTQRETPLDVDSLPSGETITPQWESTATEPVSLLAYENFLAQIDLFLSDFSYYNQVISSSATDYLKDTSKHESETKLLNAMGEISGQFAKILAITPPATLSKEYNSFVQSCQGMAESYTQLANLLQSGALEEVENPAYGVLTQQIITKTEEFSLTALALLDSAAILLEEAKSQEALVEDETVY